MWLQAKKTAWSSQVGQGVALLDETGAVACLISIHSVRIGLDPKEFAGDVATLICLHFNGEKAADRCRHDNAKEVSGSQSNGFPGGDVVEMKCPDCGAEWESELPQ